MASEQNDTTETAKPLFYAYSRRSDHENFSRYILIFKNADVCNKWWELVQAEFPDDAVRPAPQLFSFKGDDFPGKVARNKAFQELKNTWFYTQLGDSTGTGGRSLSLLPAQGYDGTIIARSSGSTDGPAAEAGSAGAGGLEEAGEMSKILQSLQRTVEEMAKDVHKVTEAQGKGQEQIGGIVQLLDLHSTNQERMRQSLDSQVETQDRIRQSLDKQAEIQEKIFNALEKNNADVRSLGKKLAAKAAPAPSPAPAPTPAPAPSQESEDGSVKYEPLQSAIEQNTNAINALISEMREERKERRALDSSSPDKTESAISALISEIREERRDRQVVEQNQSADSPAKAEKPDKDMPLSPAGLVIYPPPRKIRLKKVGFAYEELPNGHASEGSQMSDNLSVRTKPSKLSKGTSNGQ